MAHLSRKAITTSTKWRLTLTKPSNKFKAIKIDLDDPMKNKKST